jgi:hypothetical protein
MGLVAPVTAEGAALQTYLRDYGTDGIDPFGVGSSSPRLEADRAQLDDQAQGERFSDAVDFSGLAYQSISGIDLTIRYESTDASVSFFGMTVPTEFWLVRAQGSAPNSGLDDDFRALDRVSGLTETTFTFDAASDGMMTDVFTHSVATETFEFWFSDIALGANTAWIHDAAVTIRGTPQGSPQAVSTPGTLALAVPAAAGLALFAVGVWHRQRRDRMLA